MRALSRLSLFIVALSAWTASAWAEDRMPWQTDLESAKRLAAQTNRLVLIHFWGPSCRPCMRLEQEVFSRPEVGQALTPNFVLVKMNVEESPATARSYGVATIPTDVVVAPNGRLIAQLQSPPSPAQYVARMNDAMASYRDLVRQSQQQSVAPPAAPAATATLASNQVYAPAAQAPPPTVGEQPPAAAPGAAPPMAPAAAADHYAEYYRQNPAAASPANPGGAPAMPPAAPSQAVAPQAPYAPNAPPPAAVQNAAVAPPQGPQLPPGCPPLGLNGYCPVMLVERQSWVMGNKAWGVVHRGRTYLFLGPQEKDKFLADPDRYAPVMSGLDPVLAIDNHVSAPGKREFGLMCDGRIYLFADESSLQRFQQNPKRYAAEALQATVTR